MIKIKQGTTYRFIILLLVIILVMNLLFALMDYASKWVVLYEYMFRTTFFIMLLCITVLAETCLILLLRRYTAFGIVMLSLLMLLMFMPATKGSGAKNYLVSILGPFLANRYTRLATGDIIMLLLLNSLLLCLMITIMIKEPPFDKKSSGKVKENDSIEETGK